ncbi:MAG: HigA family addiction module antidote protein [Actinobacteria bacterium]|nr:HigA family addiction module antidote protein [Actinomycetota bacterium]
MSAIKAYQPAEVFPVGDYLRDEIESRGWTLTDFADILGRPQQVVSQIINGHKEITARTAAEIAAATGTNAETWLQLQDSYRLWQLRNNRSISALDEVQRRAKLRSLVPVNELRKRGIMPDHDLDAQERAICALLEISSIDDVPKFKVAARRSVDDQSLSPAQVAWLACVRLAAKKTTAKQFDLAATERFAARLCRTVQNGEDLKAVPRELAKTGVRAIYVAPFAGSKIDGVAYRDGRGPVVAVSGRIAGLDSVLFTLLHELAHVCSGHIDRGYAIDSDLASETSESHEIEADKLAADWVLLGGVAIDAPYSRSRVIHYAESIGVSPAVVVGRLHHTNALPWSHLRKLVPNVRAELASWPG